MGRDLAAATVQQLGEQGILATVQRFCAAGIVGDDGAVLSLDAAQQLVVTTDMLVEEVHFSLGRLQPKKCTMTATDLGWRAAAVNLSDLAAMGATPLGLTVALGIPGDFPAAWVELLYRGLTDCSQAYGTELVGGDLCRSPTVTLAVTALGQVPPTQIIRRTVAQVGDAIAVTGFHGASRAGLELLLHPEQGLGLSEVERNTLIRAHQHPLPRLDVPPLLNQIFQAQQDSNSLRVAGMDSSDGLADAVVQLCRASSVGAQIKRDRIPLSPALQNLVSPEQAIQWALYGGEDFELVLCLPRPLARQLVKALGEGAAIIGTVTGEPEVSVVDENDQQEIERLTLDQGFQHF